MNTPYSAIIFCWLLIAAGARAAEERLLDPFAANRETARLIAENERRQNDEAKTWQVAHAFRFTNMIERSGITFVQRPVDDGLKDYKAVHYDHGNGMAVADVDGDSHLDIYLVNQIGGNELWRNKGDGSFQDITAKAGVALADKISVAAAFGDLDNDGLDDLIVTTVRMGTVFFRNRGDGKFQDGTADSGLMQTKPGHGSGLVLFDFNQDGLLDIFITQVGVYTTNQRGRGGFYRGREDAFQGWRFRSRSEQSLLYANLGGGKFRDVSREMGLEHRGWSGEAIACDLNSDQYPDLYVLSMSGDDRYYENQGGGGFVDRTDTHFAKTPWGAMGAALLDYNLDGLVDIYITDMHSDMSGDQLKESETNSSPAFEKVKSDRWCATGWTREALQNAANNILGNALFQGEAGGRFTEASQTLGLETFWPWGPSVGDVNADGYEDVFVTAGMGYPLRYAANSLLLNEHGKRFVDSEYVVGIEPRAARRVEQKAFTIDCDGEDQRNPLCRGRQGTYDVLGSLSSRSSAIFDIDNDGDLDIVTNEWNDRPQVLVNDLAQRAPISYLKVKLAGRRANRNGLGAVVKVLAGGRTYVRYHGGKSGYLGQSSLPLYFGLGESRSVDKIEVEWPGGKEQTLTGVSPNQTLVINEPPE